MSEIATCSAAMDLLELVLDEGCFESWDQPVDFGEFSTEYRETLQRAQARARTDESVVTGLGRIRGRPVVVLLSNLDFLGGSIGKNAAARMVAAIRRATDEGMAVLAAPASGGTRMQEGTPALAQMIDFASVDGAQAGGLAVSGVPTPSHNRRGTGFMGVPGARHGGRTRCSDRVSRYESG